jgi:predicted  nucleic acid-binding Zn-ribbon protein
VTDPSTAPDKPPDVAETVNFLRRFADLMANGYNAAYLHRASDLLETLTARVVAASDEENLWRYKYEALTQHANALEAECEELKHDVDGHLDLASSILTERDNFRAALRAREAELSELRVGFDQERAALKATLEARGEECDRLRGDMERERDDGAAKLAAREAELSEFRVAFDRERTDLQVQLKVRGDELAALRTVSEREQGALREKVASLEAKRAELRSAFDRINYLKDKTTERQDGGDHVQATLPPAQRGERDFAVGETDAVVPKATLRQARAQFEYLATQFIPLGDIASQVMCELGAYNMDLALVAGQQPDHLPVGEVARSILAPAASTAPVAADTM